MGKSLIYMFYGYGGGDAFPDALKLIAMGILAVALVIFLVRKTSNWGCLSRRRHVYFCERVCVASILPFFRNRIDFDDAATHVMGEAFEAACAKLNVGHLSKTVAEIIARRIIEAAQKGERDPERLRDAALIALGHKPEAP
jgi:hypothetical protein